LITSINKCKDTAFVVVSCDKYSALWEPFFRCLSKYWVDCPFDKFLISNNLDVSDQSVVTVKVGEDKSYSDNLQKALEEIEYEWIILWLDDVFIADTVETSRLLHILEYVKGCGAGYLKLAADMPMAYVPDRGEEVGRLPKGIKYRSAIGCTLYKKSTLLKLLTPNASAWDLDRSTIADGLTEPFYALTPSASLNPPIKYSHLLIKGRWLIESLPFLRREGLGELKKWREVQKIPEYIYAKMYLLRLFFYRLFRVYWR
jgi:hypothetical protein